VERIIAEFACASKDSIQHHVVMREMAQEQGLGEIGRVLEVVEETALGNLGCRDDLVDRRV
jgi:hypothetical protein